MILKRCTCFFSLLFCLNLAVANAPITVAAVYNLSGSQASLDKASLQGAKLAVRRINAKGGVLGRKLVLQVVDGQSNKTTLSQAGQKLAANKKIGIAFGLGDNDMLSAFLPDYLKSGKIFVSSGATGANLTEQFRPRLFLTTFTDNVQASAGAKFVLDQLHRKKVLVLVQSNNRYAYDLAKYFVDAYQHEGGSVTEQWSFQKTLSPQTIASLKNQALSAIYLSASTETVPNVIKQIRQAKITLPIMGGDSYVADSITALPATVADSVYFTTHGNYDRNFMDPDMVAFVKYYQQRLGEKPTNIDSALGYDAVQVIAAAVKKAKSTQVNKVVKALNSLQDFPALTGDLNIGSAVVNPMVSVIKIISGKEQVAAVVIPQYIPKTIPFNVGNKNDRNTKKI